MRRDSSRHHACRCNYDPGFPPHTSMPHLPLSSYHSGRLRPKIVFFGRTPKISRQGHRATQSLAYPTGWYWHHQTQTIRKHLQRGHSRQRSEVGRSLEYFRLRSVSRLYALVHQTKTCADHCEPPAAAPRRNTLRSIFHSRRTHALK